MTNRPYRSALYIPGSKPRALDKARSLPTDAIIFDLEDAVSPGEKAAARSTLAAELYKGGYGERARIVRVNGPDTEWGADDITAVAEMDCDAILLPKVNGPEEIEAVAMRLPEIGIWAMMETPRGILNALAITSHPRLEGIVVGTNDLAKDLGVRGAVGRGPLITALQTCVLAARAGGVVALDGVYNAFKDEDGLRAECEQGRDFGFDGKTLIHPAQLEIANTAFAPSEAEIDFARRQIAAFEEAEAQGQGVAVVDGKIVENLHVDTARQMLAKADAIEALSAE